MKTSLCILLSVFLFVSGCATVQKGEQGKAPTVKSNTPANAPAAADAGKVLAAGGPDVTVKIGGDADAGGIQPADFTKAPAGANPPAAAPERRTTLDDLFRTQQIAVFDFRDTTMADVLKVFTALTGQNVVASQTLMNQKITLFLKDVTPRVALSTMCKLYNLWFTEDENVVRIITAEEYGRELVIRRDEKTVVLNLKYASVLGVADTIAKLMGDSVVYEQPEEFASYGHVGTEQGRAAGSSQGQFSSFRSSTSYRDSGSTSSRRSTAAGFEKDLTSTKIEALERSGVPGDEGVPQAAIMKDVRQERPIAHIAVFPRNNALAMRSVDSQLLDQIGKLVRELDTVTTQVLLEVKILEIAITDGFGSMFDLTHQEGNPKGQPNVDKHSTSIGGFANLTSPTMAYTFIDQHVRARLQLVEEQNRVKEIATPIILCANNAPGVFFVGEERPVTVNWEYEVRDFEQSGSRDTTRPVMVMRDVGMRVSVSPSINDDGTVTMRLNTNVSTVNQSGAFVEIVDQANNVRKLNIDTVNTSNVDTIIIARDSHTLALGGLIQERDSRLERRVPVLASIPILGILFKRTELVKQRTEIVILITPHIMMSPNAGETVSAEALGALSDHPFIKYGRPRVVEYDDKADKLRLLTPPAKAAGE